MVHTQRKEPGLLQESKCSRLQLEAIHNMTSPHKQTIPVLEIYSLFNFFLLVGSSALCGALYPGPMLMDVVMKNIDVLSDCK